MSDFFMNDRYRVLECMAQRQIIVNDEAVVKLLILPMKRM